MSDSITTFNVDLRGHKRGKCLSCDQCEEFLLRNIDITHNGWCQYCNHPPVDHEMLQTPEISAVGLHVPFLPLAESTHINLQNIPGNPFLKHESQTVLLKETLEKECSSVDPLEEVNLDRSVSPIKPSMKRKKTTPIKYIPLPEFSKVVQPILEGDMIPEKDHAQLSSILKVELISFLNRENLICSGNTSTLRWEYRNLGETLAIKYPKMLWDLPSKRQKKIPNENAPIYAVFIRRLTERRKMQRLRQKSKENQASGLMFDVVEEIIIEISPEDALSELKSVTLEAAKTGANAARIKELMRKTYEIRENDGISQLPPYMLTHTMLETEAELRLGSTMSEMEGKIQGALLKMSSEYSVPGTILEMEKIMQRKQTTYSAITMGEYSSEQKRPGPSIFFGVEKKVLLTGDNIINLEDNCCLEHAVILLLGVYYVLNLNFPAAYGQFLGLLQNIVVKGKKFPKQFSSHHLLQVTKKLT